MEQLGNTVGAPTTASAMSREAGCPCASGRRNASDSGDWKPPETHLSHDLTHQEFSLCDLGYVTCCCKYALDLEEQSDVKDEGSSLPTPG